MIIILHILVLVYYTSDAIIYYIQGRRMDKDTIIALLDNENWVIPNDISIRFAKLSGNSKFRDESLFEYLLKHGFESEKTLIKVHGIPRLRDEMAVRGLLSGLWHDEF